MFYEKVKSEYRVYFYSHSVLTLNSVLVIPERLPEIILHRDRLLASPKKKSEYRVFFSHSVLTLNSVLVIPERLPEIILHRDRLLASPKKK